MERTDGNRRGNVRRAEGRYLLDAPHRDRSYGYPLGIIRSPSADTVMAYTVMAYTVMAYTVMAYTVMTYTVMASIVMVSTVMAYNDGRWLPLGILRSTSAYKASSALASMP